MEVGQQTAQQAKLEEDSRMLNKMLELLKEHRRPDKLSEIGFETLWRVLGEYREYKAALENIRAISTNTLER